MMEKVLEEYIERILPRLWERGYHLKLAKGGATYPHLSEQTMLAHVLNGAFGFSRLWTWLDRRGLLSYDEAQHRQFLSLWTTHDLYKLVPERLGPSTFSLSQETIEEELEALGLKDFAETNWRQHRAAMVGDPSQYHGDLALCPSGTEQLLDMVHVADALASITSPRETRGVWNDLLKLSPGLKDHALHWHELADVRGLVTNQIHRAVTNVLERGYELFPLLFFATGVLYIGPRALPNVDRDRLCEQVTDEVLSVLRPGSVDFDIAQARRKGNPFRFEPFVFAIVNWEEVLRFGYSQALKRPSEEFYTRLVTKWFGRARRRKPPYKAEEMQTALRMTTELDDADFNQRWNAATTYLDFADGVVEACANLREPDERVRWFVRALGLPCWLADELAPKARLFSALTGGKACGYTVPLAYHWLIGPDFASRSAIAQDLSEVANVLHDRIKRALEEEVRPSDVSWRVLEELHVREDLLGYLKERLSLSFAPERTVETDPLPTYIRPKRQSHTNLCSLCGRASEWCQPIQTAILADSAQEFSNRLLPRPTTQQRRPWCPLCSLEFTLRLLSGLAPPPNADTGKSRRLYLYVLPTYSFTPESVEMFGGRVLSPFREVTALQVRDYGANAPSHAHLWVEKRAFDEEMVERVMGVFRRQADWVAQNLRRDGRELPGERLFTVRRDAVAQPNYLLFVWEKTVYGTTQDDAQIPTTSEMWAKAAFGASLLAALTGCKVYVTERPYLPVSDVGALKPTVILDSPHNALRSVLTGGVRSAEATCPRVSASPEDSVAPLSASLLEVLDVMASLWQVNSELKARTDPRPTKDKSVATRLEELGANPLAGAFFYRQYARLNDDATPFPIYTQACSILLERKGGEMMNIARELAEKSLALFLPSRRSGRGKAHLYEVVLRDAMDAIRKAPSRCPEELKTFAAGTLLKALERRQQSGRREGIVNPNQGDLNRLVQEFIALLVDEVLVKRANGSVAAFNRLANRLADAVYFEIDRTLPERWEKWEAQRKEREEAKTIEEGGDS